MSVLNVVRVSSDGEDLICCKVTVPTTDALGTRFISVEIDPNEYLSCEESVVYVFTQSMVDVLRVIPNALKIERVGIGIAVMRSR